MADEFFTRTQPAARPLQSGKGTLIALAAAFALGAAAVGYLAWQGLLPVNSHEPALTTPEAATAGEALPSASPSAPAKGKPSPEVTQAAEAARVQQVQTSALDSRLAALEQRTAKLDLRLEAASGNAARAEGLLIAFAARRSLDRGTPLGYLEDQLRLRFGEARPNAIATVIAAGRNPVTLDQLVAGLDALAPTLSGPPAPTGAWERMKHELSDLFVIRRDTVPNPAPANRLARARLYLQAGKISDAIGEVERLPGAADGSEWIAAARRYQAARDALDLIETTALLEPHDLKDARGKKVEQLSPAGPTP